MTSSGVCLDDWLDATSKFVKMVYIDESGPDGSWKSGRFRDLQKHRLVTDSSLQWIHS